MYVQSDARTDVRKFTPVFYKTSALKGRCPKMFFPPIVGDSRNNLTNQNEKIVSRLDYQI